MNSITKNTKVAFIDMEGVLIPEIWIYLAKNLGIDELSLTTREVNDYQKLMLYRIEILQKHKVTLEDIARLITELEPLSGAFEFIQQIEAQGFKVFIVSDCFQEFLAGFLHKLAIPLQDVFCHQLEVNTDGFIEQVSYQRQSGKHEVVLNYPLSLQGSMAVGDAFNDFSMLQAVDNGFLFDPSDTVRKKAPDDIHIVNNYREILALLR